MSHFLYFFPGVKPNKVGKVIREVGLANSLIGIGRQYKGPTDEVPGPGGTRLVDAVVEERAEGR